VAEQFEIRKAVNGEFFWHLRAGNNRLLADSGETYKNRGDCERILNWIKQNAARLEVVNADGTATHRVPHSRSGLETFGEVKGALWDGSKDALG